MPCRNGGSAAGTAAHEEREVQGGLGLAVVEVGSEQLLDERSLRDARHMLRAALDACLEGRTLKSREVLTALRQQEIKL